MQMKAQPNFRSNIGKRRGHYENCNKMKDGAVGNMDNIDRDGRGQHVAVPHPQLQLDPSRWDQAPNWLDYKH